MALRVYNTLTRQKEPFQTVQPGKVGMYVCGPTVYKPSHVGHMVGPVIFDTVKRYLLYLGYQVTFVVTVASFTTTDALLTPTTFSASIDWGDGTAATPGSIVASGSAGSLTPRGLAGTAAARVEALP